MDRRRRPTAPSSSSAPRARDTCRQASARQRDTRVVTRTTTWGSVRCPVERNADRPALAQHGSNRGSASNARLARRRGTDTRQSQRPAHDQHGGTFQRSGACTPAPAAGNAGAGLSARRKIQWHTWAPQRPQGSEHTSGRCDSIAAQNMKFRSEGERSGARSESPCDAAVSRAARRVGQAVASLTRGHHRRGGASSTHTQGK
jgi:hypothetical protein